VSGIVGPVVVFDEKVPAKPPAAYVLVSAINPRPISRSLARSRHGSDNRWRITAVSNEPVGVRSISSSLDSLDGSRVSGQRVEEVDTGMGITEDADVIVNGFPVWYTKRDFRLPQPI
jgi:hypothetical protein